MFVQNETVGHDSKDLYDILLLDRRTQIERKLQMNCIQNMEKSTGCSFICMILHIQMVSFAMTSH